MENNFKFFIKFAIFYLTGYILSDFLLLMFGILFISITALLILISNIM